MGLLQNEVLNQQLSAFFDLRVRALLNLPETGRRLDRDQIAPLER